MRIMFHGYEMLPVELATGNLILCPQHQDNLYNMKHFKGTSPKHCG